MIISGEELSEKAQKQNSINVSFSFNRGNIYDRHMRAFTGINKVPYAVIFSVNDDKNDFEVSGFISQFTNESTEVIYSRLKSAKVAYCELDGGDESYIESKYSNVKVVYMGKRYLSDFPASNIIGYVSDNVGVTGIEKVYDNILNTQKKYRVSASADALRRYIPGYKINTSDFSLGRYTLKTTLDLDFCRICQTTLEKYNVRGAVAILDCDSFDIVALASSPTFNPDDIKKYVTSPDGNLSNRAAMAYDMGSIFKIVVIAAALENNAVNLNDKFFCNGVTSVSGKRFECHNLYGHGTLNYYQAFMQSCNPAFIDIGQKTGYTDIINMAENFKIGKKIINPVDFQQSSGNLPDKDNYYMADLANVSIGQGSLSATVVHGAVLSAVIADGGIIKEVNLADKVFDNSNNIAENLRVNGEKRIMSEQTAGIIYDMMIKTNTDGTGTTGFIDYYGSGGKTGSAETGWYVNGERYQHAWFTGFFPAKKPKYAMCVFVENGKSGSESAAPIFKEVGTEIMKTDVEVQK